jgi:hypothetical protein
MKIGTGAFERNFPELDRRSGTHSSMCRQNTSLILREARLLAVERLILQNSFFLKTVFLSTLQFKIGTRYELHFCAV